MYTYGGTFRPRATYVIGITLQQRGKYPALPRGVFPIHRHGGVFLSTLTTSACQRGGQLSHHHVGLSLRGGACPALAPSLTFPACLLATLCPRYCLFQSVHLLSGVCVYSAPRPLLEEDSTYRRSRRFHPSTGVSRDSHPYWRRRQDSGQANNRD